MASSTATTEQGGARLLVFDADGRRYGCPIEAVREIVPFRAATRLPGAPPSVVGLINLRGRLVTVVDLAMHLGTRTDGLARQEGGSIVLVEAEARMVGVLVDEVRDVRTVPPEAMEPMVGDTAGDDAGETAVVVRALARFDDGVAVVLDADAMITQVLQ